MAIANNRAVFAGNTSLYFSIYNTSTSTWSNLTSFNGSIQPSFWSVALTQDGSRGVAGTNGDFIYYFTWNASTNTYNTPIKTLEGTSRQYLGIAISPSGDVLVAGTPNGIYFATWNGSNYSTLSALKTYTNGNYNNVSISPNGNRLVYMNKAGNNTFNGELSIALWNGTTFDMANAVVFDSSSPSGQWEGNLAFSPDSSVLFIYGYYYTWNAATNKYGIRTAIPAIAYKAGSDIKGVAVHDRGSLGITLHYINTSSSTTSSDVFSSTNIPLL